MPCNWSALLNGKLLLTPALISWFVCLPTLLAIPTVRTFRPSEAENLTTPDLRSSLGDRPQWPTTVPSQQSPKWALWRNSLDVRARNAPMGMGIP
jgi:hypothetical protein